MTEVYKMNIDDFNQMIISAHDSHYINGENTLIDKSANASPNDNQIYHLYSSGEITHQKGAWAYLNRSEFHIAHNIPGAREMPFKFVKEGSKNTTYVILTKQECVYFREQMEKYVNQ